MQSKEAEGIRCVASDAVERILEHSERHELSPKDTILATVEVLSMVVAGLVDAQNLDVGVEACVNLIRDRTKVHAAGMEAMDLPSQSMH